MEVGDKIWTFTVVGGIVEAELTEIRENRFFVNIVNYPHTNTHTERIPLLKQNCGRTREEAEGIYLVWCILEK